MTKIVYLSKLTSENFSTILENWKNYLLATDRKRSVRVYLTDVRLFAEWLNKKETANLITATTLDIVEYRNWLQNQNKAPATINRKLVILNVFYNWLVKQGIIPDNPVTDVKPVKTNEAIAPRWLTRQEQAALMRAVRASGNARDEAIITLLLHTGLRVGELCRLHKEDIIIGERSGKVIVRAGKGNKYREVPLNKTVRKILLNWLEQNKTNILFPSRKGKQLAEKSVFNIVAKYAYNARLKKVSPHTLRHTFCKNLLDAGIPIDRVAILAGHSKLDITKRYTMPSEADLVEAIERLAWE